MEVVSLKTISCKYWDYVQAPYNSFDCFVWTTSLLFKQSWFQCKGKKENEMTSYALVCGVSLVLSLSSYNALMLRFISIPSVMHNLTAFSPLFPETWSLFLVILVDFIYAEGKWTLISVDSCFDHLFIFSPGQNTISFLTKVTANCWLMRTLAKLHCGLEDRCLFFVVVVAVSEYSIRKQRSIISIFIRHHLQLHHTCSGVQQISSRFW